MASAICGAVRPLAEVPTKSSFVWVVGPDDSKMVWQCGEGEREETGAVLIVSYQCCIDCVLKTVV